MSKDKGRAFQLSDVRKWDLSPKVAESLHDWLQKKWDNNCRYGEASIKVFAEIAERFYQEGIESEDAAEKRRQRSLKAAETMRKNKEDEDKT